MSNSIINGLNLLNSLSTKPGEGHRACPEQSEGTAPLRAPSTGGPGVDVFAVQVYHRTWMDTQLSGFLVTTRPWLPWAT
jgi:hypothetical protein